MIRLHKLIAVIFGIFISTMILSSLVLLVVKPTKANAAEVTQAQYENWYVSYDEAEQFCYLKTDDGNLTFGFVYAYNATQLFMKKSDWNYPDRKQFNIDLTLNMFNNSNESHRRLKVYYDPDYNRVVTIDGISLYDFMQERDLAGRPYMVERVTVDFPGAEANWYFSVTSVLALFEDFRLCQNKILNSKTNVTTLPFDSEEPVTGESERVLPKVGDQNPPMISKGIVLTPEMQEEIESEQEGDQAEAEALQEYLERMQ